MELVKSGSSKEDRRRELHAKIAEARRAFELTVEPWLKELGEIAATDPPPPIVMPDGKVYTYIGPLPEWKPRDPSAV